MRTRRWMLLPAAVLVVALLALTIAVGHVLRAASASPTVVVRRAIAVMRSIDAVHATGSMEEKEVNVRDLNSTGARHIVGNCARRGHGTWIRMIVRGRQTGRHPGAIDEVYSILVPPSHYEIDQSTSDWNLWERPAHSSGRWRRVSITHEALFAWLMCPSLVFIRFRFGLPGPVQRLCNATGSWSPSSALQQRI